MNWRWFNTLLHDVGHGPFSHVSEASLARFGDKSSLKPNQRQEKIHEVITAEIILNDKQIAERLDSKQREAVVELLSRGHGRQILRQIVSGPLDADKQDYLLRDSKFCGVEYGIYDLQQLQRSLVAVGNAGEEELMIDPDGVHAIEQFVLAKYYMTANVYRHRVRVITDQMISRAIRLGIEQDKLAEMERLYRFDNTAAFIQNYLQWDDGRFMESFCPIHAKPPGPISGEMLRRLRTRTLLKQVYSDRIEHCDGRVRDTLRELPQVKHDQLRSSIEAALADFLSKKLDAKVDPNYVVAHSFGIKSVRESARNEEAEMLVRRTDMPRYFSEESKLFNSINAAFADEFVEVYAPVQWSDHDGRDTLRDGWKREIRDIMQQLCLEKRRSAP